jgi:alkylhydroperoxidase family enzyme
MPYRIDVPDGREPLEHILNHLGTSMLVDCRQRMFRTVYDAPQTSLTAREREGMRILGAVRTNCPICSSMRLWRDWPGFAGGEIPEEFYQNAIDLNLDWPGFSERERLLIEFADRFERDIDGVNGDDALWDRMHAQLTDTEIGDLVIMMATWIGTGRALKALGIGSSCEIATDETIRKLRNDHLHDELPGHVAHAAE